MQFQSDSVKRHLIALGDNYNNAVLGFDSRLLFLSADINYIANFIEVFQCINLK